MWSSKTKALQFAWTDKQTEGWIMEGDGTYFELLKAIIIPIETFIRRIMRPEWNFRLSNSA